MNLYGLLDAIIKKVNRAVKVEKQELDSSLQKQARENISVPSKNEICNPNLLDNWYFLNPVNQKGQTTYNTVGYTIDRWTAAYGDISVSLESDGLQLVSNGSNALIEQYLAEDLTGKTVCFSVLTDIGLFSETKVVDDLGYISPSVIPNIGQVEVYASGGHTIFRIWLKTEGASLKLIAAKLELSDTQTLIRQDSNGNWVLNEIPNYAEELLKCRQYDPYTGEYIGLRKFGQPRNLLDNSDFRNLVNQRGETTYTEHYGFDRWRIYSADTSMIQQDGYITVTGVLVAQNLSNIDENAIYTMAAKKTDGTVYVASGTFTAGAANGGISFNSSTVAMPSVFLSAGDWVWAALYEGEYTIDTLPNYQPKGYAVELAECQRYYQCFQSLVGEGASTPQRLFLPLPIAMRVVPTIDYTIQAGVTPAHIVMQAENTIDIKATDSSYSHLIIRLSADL